MTPLLYLPLSLRRPRNGGFRSRVIPTDALAICQQISWPISKTERFVVVVLYRGLRRSVKCVSQIYVTITQPSQAEPQKNGGEMQVDGGIRPLLPSVLVRLQSEALLGIGHVISSSEEPGDSVFNVQ